MLFDCIVLSQKEAMLVLDYLTSPSARELVTRATVWVGPDPTDNPDLADKQPFLRGVVEALACLPKLAYLHLSLKGCKPNLLDLGLVLTNNTLTTLALFVEVRLESRPSAHPSAHSPRNRSAAGQPKALQRPSGTISPF
jgi:hypothetical protein